MLCGNYTIASDHKNLRTMKNNQQPPINVHFTIKRKALLYDIENTSYVIGNIIPDDGQPQKHQFIDVAQEGNIDIVTRALDLAYSECLNFLFPYVKTPITETECGDDMLKEVEEFDFTIQMPATVSQPTVIYLKKLIHEYMVKRVMVEWTSLSYNEAQPLWELKAQDVRSKIREVLNFRIKKVRRSLHPF